MERQTNDITASTSSSIPFLTVQKLAAGGLSHLPEHKSSLPADIGQCDLLVVPVYLKGVH